MKNFWKWSLLSVFALHSITASACFHYPRRHTGVMEEGKRQVFLFHDGTYAHMVVGTTLNADKFPSEIAWVLPLPAKPVKYEEMKGPFFEELERIAPGKGPALGKGIAQEYGSSRGGKGLKVHEAIVFDHYHIQPIEILNEGSSEQFNQWLEQNKFNPMPYDKQKPYFKKGAVFLAIRMKLNKPAGGQLKARPLTIVYPAKELSFPLKFTHDTRKFDLDLFVFSQKEIKTDLRQHFLSLEISQPYSGKDKLHPFVDALVGQQSGSITRYEGRDLNSKGKKISEMVTDPTFQLQAVMNQGN